MIKGLDPKEEMSRLLKLKKVGALFKWLPSNEID